MKKPQKLEKRFKNETGDLLVRQSGNYVLIHTMFITFLIEISLIRQLEYVR
jgi:hypothetical protein